MCFIDFTNSGFARQPVTQSVCMLMFVLGVIPGCFMMGGFLLLINTWIVIPPNVLLEHWDPLNLSYEAPFCSCMRWTPVCRPSCWYETIRAASSAVWSPHSLRSVCPPFTSNSSAPLWCSCCYVYELTQISSCYKERQLLMKYLTNVHFIHLINKLFIFTTERWCGRCKLLNERTSWMPEHFVGEETPPDEASVKL